MVVPVIAAAALSGGGAAAGAAAGSAAAAGGAAATGVAAGSTAGAAAGATRTASMLNMLRSAPAKRFAVDAAMDSGIFQQMDVSAHSEGAANLKAFGHLRESDKVRSPFGEFVEKIRTKMPSIPEIDLGENDDWLADPAQDVVAWQA